jgi:hypothetical protein
MSKFRELAKPVLSQPLQERRMKQAAEFTSTDVRVKKRHLGLRLILLLVVLPALLFAGYTWTALQYAYSFGERTGYIQKISKKGWLCKTWEGELAMTTLPGTAPQIFQFSVRDDATAHKIEEASGQRVALTYEQHKGVPTSCFGETQYFVSGVRPIGQ